jgi:hypothetical protein
MKEINRTILYCVCENFCDSILLRFRLRYGKKLRFRFRNNVLSDAFVNNSTVLMWSSCGGQQNPQVLRLEILHHSCLP